MKLTWKAKLYLFAVLIAVLPGAFSSFNMINITQDELKNSRNTELNSITDQLAQRINNLYKNNWIAPLFYVKSGVENPALGIDEKMSYLQAVIQNSNDIVSIALFFKESTGFSPAITLNNEAFVGALQEKGVSPEVLNFSGSDIESLLASNSVGDPKFVEGADKWLLDMLIPIQLAGAPEGFLAAKIDLADLRNTITNHEHNQRGDLFLLNRSGEIVFGKTSRALEANPVVKEAVDLLKSGSRLNFNNSYEDAGGETVLSYAAFPVNLQWAIVAELSESKAYAAVAQMENRLILWGGFGLVIAILGMLVFSRQISKPILSISKVAGTISEGNFDVEVDYKAHDEIGLLGKTLVDMARSLKESFEKIADQNKQLEAYSHKLEDMVEERTKQLKDAQEQLIVQEKLASLGQLTAGIAHEIQNPLNFINNFGSLSAGLADELRQEVGNYEEKMDKEDYEIIGEILDDLKSNNEKINEHGKRAEKIVRGMLEHSRSDTGEMLESDINRMLNDSVNLAYHGNKSQDETFDVKIIEEYDDSIGKINCNPQALDRVILNIINNGFYATDQRKKEEGGKYVPEFKITTKKEGNKVTIRMRDNGTGIPDSVRKKIFEPFFTTKPTGEGTGLGLSLSYDIIVQMHKGNLQVNSKDGEFTEFVIEIPTDLK